MANEHWMSWKPSSAFGLNEKVSPSLETLKLGSDFSSPAVDVLDGTLSNTGSFVCTENQLLSVASFISSILWTTCHSIYISPCSFILDFDVADGFFAWPVFCWLQMLSAASSPLSAFTELGELTLLLIRLWLKGLFWLAWSFRPLRLSLLQQ